MKKYLELWKDIPNYEGYYQISNFGRVKSLKRLNVSKDILLKGSIDNYGYRVVSLSNNGNSKQFKVHQLVAIAFLNHKPNGFKGLVVDHIDNNPLNNKLSNLQIISQRKNTSKDKKRGSSKYVGVSWDKNRKYWRVNIFYNNKNYKLGSFYLEEKAANVYQEALKQINEGTFIPPKSYQERGYGFRKDRQKWQAYSFRSGKRIQIGTFNTEEEAKEAHLKYLKKNNYEIY